ncbi:Dbl homology domain-containing protein [Sistotremastrum suecicum HHB10207 ss-3]|uniref:Dbl homology domain-containing protein n=1 Tax=Sistotremastrum suecicum HHB10207 ss-3 TaxID=1314776 RepID=A0A166CH55_9AGAM|nr:Dbl homology domain-containing protein [Sistotremastrum suecicum HHB10207 ss-3]
MADEDLNLFLKAAREDAAQIRTVARQIPLVQEQATHLAAFADSLVTWFIVWSSQPSSSVDGSDDHFVALLELKRQLSDLKEFLDRARRTDADASHWESLSSQLADHRAILTADKIYIPSSFSRDDDARAFDRARSLDHVHLMNNDEPPTPSTSNNRRPTLQSTSSDGSSRSPRHRPQRDSDASASRWSYSSEDLRPTLRASSPTQSTNQKIAPRGDNFHVLIGRMRQGSEIDKRWAGVTQMEELRSYTPAQIRRQVRVDNIIKTEEAFVRDNTDAQFHNALRHVQPPILPPDELNALLTNLFGQREIIRQSHRKFLEGLKEFRPVLIEVPTMAALFKAYAVECFEMYPQYAVSIPVALERLEQEANKSLEFSILLQRPSPSGVSYQQAVKAFLFGPLEHLPKYTRVFRAIMDEPDDTLYNGQLADASNAFAAVLVKSKLVAWQTAMGRSLDFKLSWNDLAMLVSWQHYSNTEAPRQSAIFDFIADEMKFVSDMELFRTAYLQPMEDEQFHRLDPDEQHRFLSHATNITNTLLHYHSQLLQRLHKIQREEIPVIQVLCARSGIDRIAWTKIYRPYLGLLRELQAYVEDASSTSAAFGGFLKNRASQPGVDGRDISSFLQEPRKHLTKMTVHFRNIIDASDMDHPDSEILQSVSKTFTSLKAEGDHAGGKAEYPLEHYATGLLWPDGRVNDDIALDHSSRTLVHDGPAVLLRLEEPRRLAVMLILLDNYLMITKPTTVRGAVRYSVFRKPIPLELLDLASFVRRPSQESLDLVRAVTNNNSIGSILAINRRDQTEETLVLLESDLELKRWQDKLTHACNQRRIKAQSSKLYDFKLVHQRAPQAKSATVFFYNDHFYIVYAVSSDRPGLWVFKYNGQRQEHIVNFSRPRLCFQALTIEQGYIPCDDIKHIALAGDMVLILSKQNISAYSTKDLSGEGKKKVPKASVVTTGENVSLFRLHRFGNVVNLCALISQEGVYHVQTYDASVPKTKAISIGGPHQIYKGVQKLSCTFLEQIHDVLLLRIAVTSQGFRFLLPSPTTNNPSGSAPGKDSQLFPLPNDPHVNLVKRCRDSKAVSMRPAGDENLLCYETFGVYAHAESGKLTGRTIEWETGPIHTVVWRMPDLVLLIGPYTVEIREMKSGRLMQLLVRENPFDVISDGRGMHAQLEQYGVLILDRKDNSVSRLSKL